MDNQTETNLNPAAENVFAQQTALDPGGTIIGAVDTSVLRFTDAVAPEIEGDGIAVATTADEGTIVTIDKPGIYEVELELQIDGAVTVVSGVSKDAAAATLTADPTYAAAGIVKSKEITNAAAGDAASADFSTVLRVSGAEAIAGCLVRFHATDGAGGAPAGVNADNARFRVTRINGYTR